MVGAAVLAVVVPEPRLTVDNWLFCSGSPLVLVKTLVAVPGCTALPCCPDANELPFTLDCGLSVVVCDPPAALVADNAIQSIVKHKLDLRYSREVIKNCRLRVAAVSLGNNLELLAAAAATLSAALGRT